MTNDAREAGCFCENCRFVAKEVGPNVVQYWCRRFPPTLVMANNPKGLPVPGSFFPPTGARHWCGEWKTKETVQ